MGEAVGPARADRPSGRAVAARAAALDVLRAVAATPGRLPGLRSLGRRGAVAHDQRPRADDPGEVIILAPVTIPRRRSPGQGDEGTLLDLAPAGLGAVTGAQVLGAIVAADAAVADRPELPLPKDL